MYFYIYTIDYSDNYIEKSKRNNCPHPQMHGTDFFFFFTGIQYEFFNMIIEWINQKVNKSIIYSLFFW